MEYCFLQSFLHAQRTQDGFISSGMRAPFEREAQRLAYVGGKASLAVDYEDPPVYMEQLAFEPLDRQAGKPRARQDLLEQDDHLVLHPKLRVHYEKRNLRREFEGAVYERLHLRVVYLFRRGGLHLGVEQLALDRGEQVVVPAR